MSQTTAVEDMKISGNGITNGGKYNNVTISGSGKINGDIEANVIRISGAGSFQGNVKSDKFVVNGSGFVSGKLAGRILQCNGNLKVDAESLAAEFKNSGKSVILKNLKAERVRSYGCLEVCGGIEAEEFDSIGSMIVGGLLNANRITVLIGGRCLAKELGGEEIHVKLTDFSLFGRLAGAFLRLFRRGFNKLTAELIEGTHISLEHTQAKVVRGEMVTIGPKCEIELVEYKESLTLHPTAAVQRQVKM
ncbi:Polymer-forming cytoskeletal [Pelotomaculum sp. FP]|uniref:polymer-forming cytoskeletal protein n=1 Tax=Pelotomaculum sp. FP TaxID=261474 RepID=UPI001065E673|nr:polymer-forming cytoskeletal protein [Pelotomaculum sp. FP]TEB10675.1 Polymer-forming cytoskeletal [Pelotomaculum sp. FP]